MVSRLWYCSLLVAFLFFLFFSGAKAQTGGNHSLDFLNLSSNAKITGLGGLNVSSYGDSLEADLNMFVTNPALIDVTASGKLSISYMPFYAGMQYTTLAYAQHFAKAGIWAVGLQYMDYGDFDGFDGAGLPTGEFSAQDYAFVINHIHQQGNFQMGANLKVAVSAIAGYQAAALMLDLGGVFQHPTQDLTVGLVISNLGFFLSDYTSGSHSSLPADVKLGLSFKPEHMPFRFSVTGYKLLRDTKAYFVTDASQQNEDGEVKIAGKILRHITFGGELLLGKNFNVRAGYNYLNRSAFRLPQASGSAGLSFGFVVKIKAFSFEYARASYRTKGGYNHVTLTTDFERLINKKK